MLLGSTPDRDAKEKTLVGLAKKEDTQSSTVREVDVFEAPCISLHLKSRYMLLT
jgi:hypothetical protein